MPRERIKKSGPAPKTRVRVKTKATKVAKAKKKDPEAPYTDNPTPGKPGWNLAKAKRKKAYKKSKKA